MILGHLRAYLDLTRLHFFFMWPLLFCSGLFLSFPGYGGFTWLLVAKAALIALLGFEAGFVLNDIVDADLDRRDVEQKLTRYWRPFGSRPIPSGSVTRRQAGTLFLVLFATTSALIFTLPYPNSVYVFAIMMYSFVAGLVLLLAANALILRGRDSTGWLKALPLFHVTMLIYVASMIADYFV